MPTKPEGVYHDGHGKWYVKVTIGPDPLTGRRALTRRGFRTAADAGRARREMLALRAAMYLHGRRCRGRSDADIGLTSTGEHQPPAQEWLRCAWGLAHGPKLVCLGCRSVRHAAGRGTVSILPRSEVGGL